MGELVPPESSRLEGMRRALLDLFSRWGYEIVTPPLIEYLESLLTGTGEDLELHTFKLIDQLTGRMMGDPCGHDPSGRTHRRPPPAP